MSDKPNKDQRHEGSASPQEAISKDLEHIQAPVTGLKTPPCRNLGNQAAADTVIDRHVRKVQQKTATQGTVGPQAAAACLSLISAFSSIGRESIDGLTLISASWSVIRLARARSTLASSASIDK